MSADTAATADTPAPSVPDSKEVRNVFPANPTGEERIKHLQNLIEAEKGIYACGGYVPKKYIDAKDLVIYYTDTGVKVDDTGLLTFPNPSEQQYVPILVGDMYKVVES